MKRSSLARALRCALLLPALGTGWSGLVGCRPAPLVAFGSGLSPVAADRATLDRERAMFERLNRDRAQQGRKPLRFDPKLSEVARHHSADMRDHGFFAHESPRTGTLESRLDAAGYLFLAARENLSEAPDVELSQDGLLASPHHYENIMADDVTHVGIGIVPGGVEDARNLTVTQVFATPLALEAPASAVGRIFERLSRERASRRLPSAGRDAKLTELAERHLRDLDEAGGEASLERAGRAIAGALEGEQSGQLALSAQLVPSSAQLLLPDPLLAARSCRVGIAARRVQTENGRPALQVLLLALYADGLPPGSG